MIAGTLTGWMQSCWAVLVGLWLAGGLQFRIAIRNPRKLGCSPSREGLRKAPLALTLIKLISCLFAKHECLKLELVIAYKFLLDVMISYVISSDSMNTKERSKIAAAHLQYGCCPRELSWLPKNSLQVIR
ncbi:hypothetical protein QBC35DRAFT_275142 [Podospora australis]|uniref:Uncharacterized protein n=1 Tax=Podospora australis TaxID=1536484 RepID=A0AAN6WQR1_9PEZI|nr:hypothetical protein QBC35DRAFT_275142 [Podospora australis]